MKNATEPIRANIQDYMKQALFLAQNRDPAACLYIRLLVVANTELGDQEGYKFWRDIMERGIYDERTQTLYRCKLNEGQLDGLPHSLSEKTLVDPELSGCR